MVGLTSSFAVARAGFEFIRPSKSTFIKVKIPQRKQYNYILLEAKT